MYGIVFRIRFSRDLGHDYKTCFVLLHKVREALGLVQSDGPLNGVVEIDGAYFGGYVKPANKKMDRIDRRLAEHQTGKRQVVITMRERKGRTRAFVVKSERDGVALAASNIQANSTVHADEASHWDVISARFDITRIDAYATEMAWRENASRTSNGQQFLDLTDAVTMAPKSKKWCGYWQRRKSL